MKLSYPDIFRAGGVGEDSEIYACGLSRAYMRFLFSCTEFPHTFWNGTARTYLTDTERQLIESGATVLTNLECNQMTQLVFDKQKTADQAITQNLVWFDLIFNTGTGNVAYIQPDEIGQVFTIKTAGLYSFVALCRVRTSATGTGDFEHNLRFTRNGVQQKINSSSRTANFNKTILLVWYKQLEVNDYVNVQYYHTFSSTVTLNNTAQSLQVVYHG